MTFCSMSRQYIALFALSLSLIGCASPNTSREIALQKQLELANEQLRQKQQQEELAKIERERREFEARILQKAQQLADQRVAIKLQKLQEEEEKAKAAAKKKEEEEKAKAAAKQKEEEEKIINIEKEQAVRDSQRLAIKLQEFSPKIDALTAEVENIKEKMDTIPPQDRKEVHLRQQKNLILTFNNVVENFEQLNQQVINFEIDPALAETRFQMLKEKLNELISDFTIFDKEITEYANQMKVLPWPGSSPRNSRSMSLFLKSRALSLEVSN